MSEKGPPTCDGCGEVIDGPASWGFTFSMKGGVRVPGSQRQGLYHPECGERQQEIEDLQRALSLPV